MNKAKLFELVEFAGGGTPDRKNEKYWGGDIPWATVKDIQSMVISYPKERITQEGLSNSASRIIPAGTIIIPTRMALGKACYFLNDVAINQDLKAMFITDHRKVDRDYLLRFMISQSFRIEREGKGATVKGIGLEVLRNIEIPLFSIPEQKRIAAILNTADSIRTMRKAAIVKLDQLAQAVFLEMFGPNLCSQWSLTTIQNVTSKDNNAIRTGPFGSQLLHKEFVDNGINVLGIDNVVQNRFMPIQSRCITEEKYEQLKRYTVFPGDVLITIMGTCGKCAIVPQDVPLSINTKHLCCISPEKSSFTSEYIQYWFLYHPFACEHLALHTKGAIMDGLNMGIIKDTPISIPPYARQKLFSERIRTIEILKGKIASAQENDEYLFHSLQSRAFTGQL